MSHALAPPKGGIVVVIVGGRSIPFPTTEGETVHLKLQAPDGEQLAAVTVASTFTWEYTGPLPAAGQYLLLVTKPSGNGRHAFSIE